jgi:DNA-binding transcriptional LysR family regulator
VIGRITAMNLAAVDLNLLLVLHTVLEERSATRAARRLHVTQSAISNALARLRALLGDPLFVRSGRALAPTSRAAALQPRLADALRQLEGAIAAEPSFDPRTSERRFTIACTDYDEVTFLPHVVALFARRMPLASLRVVTLDYVINRDAMATGEVDLLLALSSAPIQACDKEELAIDDVVLVARRDHPGVGVGAGGRLSRVHFNSLRHVDLMLFGDKGLLHRPLERTLARAGLVRNVALAVPHFFVVALAVARTDFIAGLPRTFAREMAALLPLRLLETPVRIPGFSTSMFWHHRTREDAAGVVFRQIVREAVAQAKSVWRRARRRGVIR